MYTLNCCPCLKVPELPSIKNEHVLKSDGQQFHQYQQNKERLNSDGQQFHQYQHSKQSPLILAQ
jgi:hypothetical protein